MRFVGPALLYSGRPAVLISRNCRRARCSSPLIVRRPAFQIPLRSFSVMETFEKSLFEYTSGRWIINDSLRHDERRRVFNVVNLSQLAADSVHRRADDIVSFNKLGEGGFNRTFLVVFRDNFRLVARIPYPITIPKFYAVASEVATMDFLRSSGLPIPAVYGYSPLSDNAAGTEYIFMEFVDGINLSDIWFELGEAEVESVLRQLVEFEAKVMAASFPVGGSLYYSRDLKKMGTPGIPLEDSQFCVGPDVGIPLWYGRRSQLNINRGPYKNAQETLLGGARKELAYLQEFGRPQLPFDRMRRENYRYEEQSPSDHIENLQRYLTIAPLIVPKAPALSQFRMRHPDFQSSNIVVTKSPSTGLLVKSVLDWQHTTILPTFLLADMPQTFQNYDDRISQSMTRPSLPDDYATMDDDEQSFARELHRRRLVHYHYLKYTQELNEIHHTALSDALGTLRRRLFRHSGYPWEGETMALKVALIDASRRWEELTEGGTPCSIQFTSEDVAETMKLNNTLREADASTNMLRNLIGCGSEGWVPNDLYDKALARSRKLKEDTIAQTRNAQERAEVETHWPFDDMEEERYT